MHSCGNIICLIIYRGTCTGTSSVLQWSVAESEKKSSFDIKALKFFAKRHMLKAWSRGRSIGLFAICNLKAATSLFSAGGLCRGHGFIIRPLASERH